jgi:hypothetical protein
MLSPIGGNENKADKQEYGRVYNEQIRIVSPKLFAPVNFAPMSMRGMLITSIAGSIYTQQTKLNAENRKRAA